MMNQNQSKFVTLAASLAAKYHLLDDIDDESDSDDEEDILIASLGKKKVAPQRIENYVETVLERFTNKQFQQNFRITVEKFNVLLQVLGPSLQRQSESGRRTVNAEKQILSVIWLLATPDSYRSVGERFNLGKSSLSKCFMRIIKLLNHLAPTIIKWPSQHDRTQIKEAFLRMGSLPNIIGVVDGTYVTIKAPKEDPEVYVTRKCTYAMTLQAICDPQLKFTDSFMGYPGSVSDNRIFRNSHIFAEIQNHRNTYVTGDEYIIGDKAYPLLEWCIPPFINRGNMTPSKIYFNTQQAKTRQTIERTFALLFGRFRRLKYLDMNRTDLIPTTVLAACVLHNICRDPELDNGFIEEGLAHLNENRAEDIMEIQNQNELQNIEGGREKREELCRQLYLQRDQRIPLQ